MQSPRRNPQSRAPSREGTAAIPPLTEPPARPDIARLARMPHRRRQRWLWPVLAALLAGALVWYEWAGGGQADIIYDTAPVVTGDLEVTVIATGTVQPTTQVELSSELSGTLASVEVDYNDPVTEGQVLARLDDTKLRAAVTNAKAQLASARARLFSAEATVTETAEALASAEALDKRGLNTRQTTVAARAAHDRATAAVDMAEAEVTLAEANLAAQEADLDKAEIRSPINGIVLTRAAERGQIVAASLNAPILFTLAEDLRRMELRVSVDEADIGRVQVGQEASFTVDAFPGRRFEARITSLRYAPDEAASVVSYTAVLTFSNEDMLLRPGMTATATIVIARETGVKKVPLAALRYAPPVAASSERSGRGLLGLILPGRMGREGNAGRTDGSGLWVLKDGAPVRVRITPGANDGTDIAVSSDELSPGDEVILGQREGR